MLSIIYNINMSTLLIWLISVGVLVVLSIYIYIRLYKQGIESFENRTLNCQGDLKDDIAQGNPASLSGYPNPYIDINQKGIQDPIIYQGSGIPLIHEDHPTIPNDSSMFYFKNYSCRPECCQYSAYSCNNGCVCWEAPPQSYLEQNSQLSPRS